MGEQEDHSGVEPPQSKVLRTPVSIGEVAEFAEKI